MQLPTASLSLLYSQLPSADEIKQGDHSHLNPPQPCIRESFFSANYFMDSRMIPSRLASILVLLLQLLVFDNLAFAVLRKLIYLRFSSTAAIMKLPNPQLTSVRFISDCKTNYEEVRLRPQQSCSFVFQLPVRSKQWIKANLPYYQEFGDFFVPESQLHKRSLTLREDSIFPIQTCLFRDA